MPISPSPDRRVPLLEGSPLYPGGAPGGGRGVHEFLGGTYGSYVGLVISPNSTSSLLLLFTVLALSARLGHLPLYPSSLRKLGGLLPTPEYGGGASPLSFNPSICCPPRLRRPRVATPGGGVVRSPSAGQPHPKPYRGDRIPPTSSLSLIPRARYW